MKEKRKQTWAEFGKEYMSFYRSKNVCPSAVAVGYILEHIQTEEND